GLAIYFPGPNSFTGEDVLELHAHGGQVIMDLLIQNALKLHCRIAQPGEFSFRAFMNDKMDLAQAEAIADLIDSNTEAAARSAMRSLKGDFSQKINELLEELIHVRMYVESSIDFPEEEIDFLADEQLKHLMDNVLAHIKSVFETAKQGYVLKEGMTAVIVGQPNAGKSSLLNELAGHNAAIVTDIAGTTRDVLREQIQIDGMPLHIIDTAGLREDADVVEQEGIKRAWLEIEKADHVLLMLDDSQGFSNKDANILSQLPQNLEVTVVHNKIDLTDNKPRKELIENQAHIFVSAKQQAGIHLLKEHLKGVMGFKGETEGLFIARRRHLDALERARNSVESGYEQFKFHNAGELLAEDLRQAQKALNEITGEFDNEDLLGEIFSSFCIGK
ncbi:MAG: tRNA uridine-5-carboxymethylaminomethyl(34) synthesis GTPase MnmE, partial [Gammaproteobacteria bacterium]|nr:tRNA uridine-5-carboxymethylaminomethyl(34) synthesis GTPase MnmE [Gammaproteobacteria bacterium]